MGSDVHIMDFSNELWRGDRSSYKPSIYILGRWAESVLNFIELITHCFGSGRFSEKISLPVYLTPNNWRIPRKQQNIGHVRSPRSHQTNVLTRHYLECSLPRWSAETGERILHNGILKRTKFTIRWTQIEDYCPRYVRSRIVISAMRKELANLQEFASPFDRSIFAW